MICIWSSWCHCHSIISCFSKIQNSLPFQCQLTKVVLKKKSLNGYSNSVKATKMQKIVEKNKNRKWLEIASLMTSWACCHINISSISTNPGCGYMSCICTNSTQYKKLSYCWHACMHATILQPSWILSGTTRVSWHQKGKTNLDLLEQEIVSGWQTT